MENRHAMAKGHPSSCWVTSSRCSGEQGGSEAAPGPGGQNPSRRWCVGAPLGGAGTEQSGPEPPSARGRPADVNPRDRNVSSSRSARPPLWAQGRLSTGGKGRSVPGTDAGGAGMKPTSRRRLGPREPRNSRSASRDRTHGVSEPPRDRLCRVAPSHGTRRAGFPVAPASESEGHCIRQQRGHLGRRRPPPLPTASPPPSRAVPRRPRPAGCRWPRSERLGKETSSAADQLSLWRTCF